MTVIQVKTIQLEKVVVSKKAKEIERVYKIKYFRDPNNWTVF